MASFVPIQSTQIAAIRYCPDAKSLHVLFATGSMYAYTGVPQSAYDELIDANAIPSKSVGKVFGKVIKGGGYAFEKVWEVGKKKEVAA